MDTPVIVYARMDAGSRAAEISTGFAREISLETDRMAAQQAVPVADLSAYGHREQSCRAWMRDRKLSKLALKEYF